MSQEDSLRALWALVPDLMLRSRVAGLARDEELEVRFFARPEDVLEALGATDRPGPSLVLADLGAPADAGFKLVAALAERRATGQSTPPILAFFSHVDVAAREKALALGADKVVPRSALVARFGTWVAELSASDSSGS